MAKSISLMGTVTKFYSYRNANLNGMFIQIDVTPEDVKYISQYLNRFGHKMDNHICWECTYYGNILYYSYSDGKLSIGPDIHIGRW